MDNSASKKFGCRYVFAKEKKDNTLLPDNFADYRYENPDGKFNFRARLSFPCLFSLGTGYNFGFNS